MYRSKANKSKRNRRLGILLALMLVAVLTGLLYRLLETHTIQTVYVEGNVHYSKEEIQDMVFNGPLSRNSLYLSFVYKDKQITDVPFIAAMDVQVLAPDTVKILVYEKSLAGYVEYLGKYMYFDKDGTIVESSGIKTAGIPQVTGLSFDHVVIGEPLPVENIDIFYQILTVTKALTKYELTADKLYFNRQGDMTIYFGDVKILFGQDSYLDEKMGLIQSILPNLEGLRGSMSLENYDGTSGFKPIFQPET